MRNDLVPPWLQGLVAGVVSAVLVGSYYYEHVEARLQDELRVRPKVVVVDVGTLAAREFHTQDLTKIEAALERTTRLIEKLRDSGFLVLDAKYVLDAPKDLYLETIIDASEEEGSSGHADQ